MYGQTRQQVPYPELQGQQGGMLAPTNDMLATQNPAAYHELQQALAQQEAAFHDYNQVRFVPSVIINRKIKSQNKF